MTFTLYLTMGTILKPSRYDLSAVFRSWNINSKNVSYVERKVGEGVYMDYTITVDLAKAYPTPGGGGGGGGGGGTVPIEAIRSTSPGGIVPMMTP